MATMCIPPWQYIPCRPPRFRPRQRVYEVEFKPGLPLRVDLIIFIEPSRKIRWAVWNYYRTWCTRLLFCCLKENHFKGFSFRLSMFCILKCTRIWRPIVAYQLISTVPETSRSMKCTVNSWLRWQQNVSRNPQNVTHFLFLFQKCKLSIPSPPISEIRKRRNCVSARGNTSPLHVPCHVLRTT